MELGGVGSIWFGWVVASDLAVAAPRFSIPTKVPAVRGLGMSTEAVWPPTADLAKGTLTMAIVIEGVTEGEGGASGSE